MIVIMIMIIVILIIIIILIIINVNICIITIVVIIIIIMIILLSDSRWLSYCIHRPIFFSVPKQAQQAKQQHITITNELIICFCPWQNSSGISDVMISARGAASFFAIGFGTLELPPARARRHAFEKKQARVRTHTHGSFQIRRQRGYPGVVLQLVVSNSANHWEGMRLELSPIRNEPN